MFQSLECQTMPISASNNRNAETFCNHPTTIKQQCFNYRTKKSSTLPKKGFKCDVCDKTFKHKCNLSTHKKIHTNQALKCTFLPKEIFKHLAPFKRAYSGTYK